MRAHALTVFLPVMILAGTVRAEPLPRLHPSEIWYHNIEEAPLHPNSASMISTLDGLGGFGLGRMQIDFSIYVVHADAVAPMRTIVQHNAWGYYTGDCDPVGTQMPVPTDARIEGTTGLTCNNTSADCHLLVVQGRTLYEAYSATASGPNNLEALCLAVWDLDALYPPEGRGEHCTSADAAGFPMAPLLFNADEIQASLDQDPTGGGDIGHAIRFILPNNRMANDPSLPPEESEGGRLYVRPASHAGNPQGPVGSVPYGARLRLRDDFPLDHYPAGAKVILNTMKRFGIVLSDGGYIALTAENDHYNTTKWSELGIGSRVFDQTTDATDVSIADFEVIDTGPRIGETWDCVRSTPTPAIYADGFESKKTAGWTSTIP